MKQKNGFTLIELLVVVSVIAVLSGLMLTVIDPRGLRAKTRDSQRIADLKKIQPALELYFADFRAYPASGSWGTWVKVTGADYMSTALSPNYLSKVPVDPTNDAGNANPCSGPTTYRYNYRSSSTGRAYILAAIMEVSTSNDGFECNLLNSWSTLGCGAVYATSGVCYGVENP